MFKKLNDIHTIIILYTLYSHSYTRMKLVIQRVLSASVTVNGRVIGEIGNGLLVFVGIHDTDGDDEVKWVARKLTSLRIFSDEEGKMNRSVVDVEGSVCLVSQFTLYGDATKGTRPSFVDAGKPEHAEALYKRLINEIQMKGITVSTGSFGDLMKVSSVNDGPVTILLERGV